MALDIFISMAILNSTQTKETDMFQDNDMVAYDQDEPVTCPDCGSDCELSGPDGGVAECRGCGIAFNFKIEKETTNA